MENTFHNTFFTPNMIWDGYINRIERRFVNIQSAEDFTLSHEGLDKLDGIAMMLIGMGESIKNRTYAVVRRSIVGVVK
ncbi:MAG: hypothetical protein F6K42_21245 [Leptolyngbya sp. SIO1D8]|nr:hypothetical protein [Leptolyngbya sp. SIO1D8]